MTLSAPKIGQAIAVAKLAAITQIDGPMVSEALVTLHEAYEALAQRPSFADGVEAAAKVADAKSDRLFDEAQKYDGQEKFVREMMSSVSDTIAEDIRALKPQEGV